MTDQEEADWDAGYLAGLKAAYKAIQEAQNPNQSNHWLLGLEQAKGVVGGLFIEAQLNVRPKEPPE